MTGECLIFLDERNEVNSEERKLDPLSETKVEGFGYRDSQEELRDLITDEDEVSARIEISVQRENKSIIKRQ